ncbi:hypothetical protein, variant 2 [Verruconis gallopava]|nr:hypothetical protein, variant 1 [Verruconis gallopava]XP_016216562.1 hypothetical protein, variant 2 [Verruconis gallopava]KIW06692.1 hypothetical protein, variant 1 [Verruconis gallopava]KIW06693.1 hypothetical protein, variant 2 [Verruconis gallopava]
MQQRPEDFMDEEDLADAEDAKRLHTAAGYSGLGGAAVGVDGSLSGNALLDIMRVGGADSKGAMLLRRMGWREGQGIGPKVKRKARYDEDDGNDDVEGETHLFAPEDSKMIAFEKKSDCKGLGYAGELSLHRTIENNSKLDSDDDDDDSAAAWNRAANAAKLKKLRPSKTKKPSFGVGVLNDTGSDDEDPYEIGPKISYNRTIGGDKKPTKKKTVVGGANPLLASRPVFVSKKNAPAGKAAASGFRKCHDGRLPLDGFVLAMQALDISPINKYPPPKIPDGWKPKRSRWDVAPAEEHKSTADMAKTSSLDPKARAAALGEEMLPGKSIFDYISSAARDKLAAVAGRSDLPQGRGEDAPEGYRLTEEDKQKQMWNSVPTLSRSIALEALQRGASGWMPYADDEAKRARYRAFLELKAGIRDANILPERAKGMSTDDWRNELREFAQAAEVFRPITGAMASRFTSSSRAFEGTLQNTDDSGGDAAKDAKGPLLSKPAAKPEDPAEAAAKIGMYGHMTRTVLPFYPTRLLCKRFGVRPPTNVQLDPSSEQTADATAQEMVPRKAIERMMQDAALRRFTSSGFEGGSDDVHSGQAAQVVPQAPADNTPSPERVDAERNEALEAERPGDAVFKAIFGSDDEDED